jgi:hypothetical protein
LNLKTAGHDVFIGADKNLSDGTQGIWRHTGCYAWNGLESAGVGCLLGRDLRVWGLFNFKRAVVISPS